VLLFRSQETVTWEKAFRISALRVVAQLARANERKSNPRKNNEVPVVHRRRHVTITALEVSLSDAQGRPLTQLEGESPILDPPFPVAECPQSGNLSRVRPLVIESWLEFKTVGDIRG
jgi:hypothetical protein